MSVQTPLLAAARRAFQEIALLAAIGVFLGLTAPFSTGFFPFPRRMLYWTICIVGGGAIGILIDAALSRFERALWLRISVTALLMTPAVSALVMTTGHILVHQGFNLRSYLGLLWQVLLISAPVLAVRALVWRRPPPSIQTQIVIAPPLPEAERQFRQRLSAKRRTARLIAIQAHDHYLRVHTDAGTELLTVRFADALVELERAHGFQTHRSWWVEASAIQSVSWRRGSGEVCLIDDLRAPVSRAHAPALRAAGWT